MRQPNTAILQILVAALPEAALRPLVLELVLGGATVTAPLTAAVPAIVTPERVHKGWPPGKPRGGRRKPAAARDAVAHRAWLDARNAKLAAKRAAARAAKQPPNGNGAGNTAGNAEPLAAQVWKHAERLDQKAPYRAVARALDLNDQLVLDHFRRRIRCRRASRPPKPRSS
jgi:hypothetical protein